MTLDQLDKNSKYGYRRDSWFDTDSYIAFNGTAWIFVNKNGKTSTLIPTNQDADDWYLSHIPNKFYKRVAIVTGYEDDNFIKGDRIIQCDYWTPTNNKWRHADYSSTATNYRTPGTDCEWEDEIKPCKDRSNHELIVQNNRTGEVILCHGQDDKGWYKTYALSGNLQRLNPAYHTVLSTDATTAMSNRYFCDSKEPLSCSSEPITQTTTQKENTMDLRLLLTMMAAMSETETPKDATNSKHVVIVTKDDAYEGYFYADDLEDVKAIVAEPKNELKKFHVFDYQTTLGQKPRKVIEVDRC